MNTSTQPAVGHSAAATRELTIVDVEAIACSVPLDNPVNMGLGQAVKREAVVVKVTTNAGLVGYGEAHHTRAPAAIAALINTTIRDLVLGRDACSSVAVWQVVYRNQLVSHGAGAAAVCALSGLDTALWDVRAKALNVPLYKLLGGRPDPIPAYAGGVALGYQPPERLVEEVGACVEGGFRSVKLRIGESVPSDLARVRAVREAYPDLELFTDANTTYSLQDVRQAAPVLADLGVGWLEEPFPPSAWDSYQRIRGCPLPVAAGENHYLRFDFDHLVSNQVVEILQPDIAKCGGITEFLRIVGLAGARGLVVNPHSSVTGINLAATIHVIASTAEARFFEADVARGNTLRNGLCSEPYQLDDQGRVAPLQSAGIGVEVDEDFLHGHPLTPGSAFVPWDSAGRP